MEENFNEPDKVKLVLKQDEKFKQMNDEMLRTKIDVSKIANAEAAMSVDKMSKNILKDEEDEKVVELSIDEVNSNYVSTVPTQFYKKSEVGKYKFDFRQPELIPLPSKGKLYSGVTEDEDVLSGYIKMLPMTMEQEEILSTPKFLKAGVATRMVLGECIVSNIKAEDLLLFDSNFLLYYLRSISYGDEYSFDVQCENQMCGKTFEHTVNISKLSFEEIPEDFVEPIEVKLPSNKYTVKTVLPRMKHTEIIKKNSDKKTSDSKNETSMELLLVTTLKITAPDGSPIPKEAWKDFYAAIIGTDIATLREKNKLESGLDDLDNIICPYCETEFDTQVPISSSFFRF